MDKLEITKKIKAIASKRNIKISENDFNKSLKDIGVDSLSAVSLIIDLEDACGITVPDDKLTTIKNVNELITIVLEEAKRK
ncbi:MAG: hypothetical protein Ta2E_07230 [Mycoplasmoidaceae bacterium]|nr:MAG: hypothetical protein Ta2E_05100 [Mycoplasmoidaceae bacterium]GMO16074.1 MAG: hypothetical protein Ta2E_07230 [Mycoplasmoidaceae bacterium]